MTIERDINDLQKGRSLMQFIEDIRELYKLGKREFGRVVQVSYQLIDTWVEGADKVEAFLKALCKFRKLSGKSWNQFGEMLDSNYLPKEEWKETKKLLEYEQERNKPKGKKWAILLKLK